MKTMTSLEYSENIKQIERMAPGLKILPKLKGKQSRLTESIVRKVLAFLFRIFADILDVDRDKDDKVLDENPGDELIDLLEFKEVKNK